MSKAEVKDAEGIAKVHIDTMRTTHQGIYPADFLSSLSYEKARHRWETVYLSPKSHDAVYVAEDDSKKIVGFMIYGKDRDNDTIYKGEVGEPIEVVERNECTENVQRMYRGFEISELVTRLNTDKMATAAIRYGLTQFNSRREQESA